MENFYSRSSKLNLVKKFQVVNPERFATLCRMHLSFTLDLGDGAFSNLLEPKDSGKSKKAFHYFHRKQKAKGVENTYLTQECIGQIYQLIEFLGRDINVCQEGLFRKTGNLSRQQDLKNLLSSGIPVDLELGQYSIHDCACVLKNFLSELPEPLLTEAHFTLYCQVPDITRDDMCSEEQRQAYQRQLKIMRLLFLLLQPENYCLVKKLLNLLHRVSIARTTNCMDAPSLATVFAPHILCPKKMTPQELRNNFPRIVKAVTFMIKHAPNLFEPPNELVQDIFICLKYSEDSHLLSNSSIDCITDSETEAVQTAVTFCDRRNMPRESSAEYTAKALEELYAYVHDMPDCSQKKKYLKQLNKENGHSTPVSQPKKRDRSRTVDSIKKHFRRSTKRRDHDHIARSSSFEKLLSYSSTLSPSRKLEKVNSKVLQVKNLPIDNSHPSHFLKNCKQVEVECNVRLFEKNYSELKKKKTNSRSKINLHVI